MAFKTGSYKTEKNNIIKESSSGIELTDGMYCGSIVGYIVFKKEAYNEGDDPFDAIKFYIQLVDDAGKSKVVQTNDWRVSLAEKSTLFKQLSGWVKSTSPNDLWERLEKANFMDANGVLDFDKFLGTHPALMVKMVPSKKDPAKSYPDFTLAATKKGQEHQIDTGDFATGGQPVPLWVPDYVADEEVVAASCLDGFEIKRYEKKEKDEDPENKDRKKVYRRTSQPAETPAETPVQEAAFPEQTAQPAQPAPTKASERLTIRKRPKTVPVADNTAIDQADNPDMPF